MLGDRHRQSGNVDFLEGIPAEQGSSHLTGDGDDRHGIHIGGGQAGDQIGRAGTGGGDTDADLAGGAGISVRRMHRPLFMHRQDMTQRSVA